MLPAAPAAGRLVGRDRPLGELRDCLARAVKGERRILFLTGEPGIGKTALVDEFLRRTPATPFIRFARGQCVEGYGGKESYYPMLETLGQLRRGPRETPWFKSWQRRLLLGWCSFRVC